MKAKELAELLLKYPEHDVYVFKYCGGIDGLKYITNDFLSKYSSLIKVEHYDYVRTVFELIITMCASRQISFPLSYSYSVEDSILLRWGDFDSQKFITVEIYMDNETVVTTSTTEEIRHELISNSEFISNLHQYV